jgi:hypothetical protein
MQQPMQQPMQLEQRASQSWESKPPPKSLTPFLPTPSRQQAQQASHAAPPLHPLGASSFPPMQLDGGHAPPAAPATGSSAAAVGQEGCEEVAATDPLGLAVVSNVKGPL